MDLPKTVHELQGSHQHLLDALIQQLQKDFGDVVLEFDSALPPLEGILKELVSIVGALLEQNASKLMSVLYRIDVSEPNLKAALLRDSVAPPANVIAEMILEREYQKVYFRSLYSSERKA